MKNFRLTFVSFMCLSGVFFTLAVTTGKPTFAPNIKGWFFRAVSGYPTAVVFEPVVLFKNGDYFAVDDEPLDQLNITDSKSKHPEAWGTWKKQGDIYRLTGSNGKPHDYKLGDGNWFRAYAYNAALHLKKSYQKVSDGGYGNGLNTLNINKIAFVDSTHFRASANSGVSKTVTKSWKKPITAGTYKIHGNTIEFTQRDGKAIKKSFAMGATRSSARPANTMIFIGGNAYTNSN